MLGIDGQAKYVLTFLVHPPRHENVMLHQQAEQARAHIDHRAGREGPTGPLTYTSSIGIVSTARAQSAPFNPSVWC